MPTPRWLVRLTIPLIAAGAALASSAAIATADPPEDAYFAKLRAVGLNYPPKTEQFLINEAHYVCYDLTYGWTPQQIANGLHADYAAHGLTLTGSKISPPIQAVCK